MQTLVTGRRHKKKSNGVHHPSSSSINKTNEIIWLAGILRSIKKKKKKNPAHYGGKQIRMRECVITLSHFRYHTCPFGRTHRHASINDMPEDWQACEKEEEGN